MSQYEPTRTSARAIDLSARIAASTAVVASPTGSSETIVASVTLPNNVQVYNGVEIVGFAAFTVGTSGASATVIVRQTSTAGTSVATTGALTVTATDLYSVYVAGFDTAPAAGQVYKLTLTVGSGAAASTVSAVYLRALIV